MPFIAQQLVVKISISNILSSESFYKKVLGFKVDERCTINKNGQYEAESYVELNAPSTSGGAFTLGLYKYINKP